MQDQLLEVISTLQRRIKAHEASLRENEIRTRTTLIDPLLKALGWDVSDPEMVTLESNVGRGRADYALHGGENKPFAVLEAKRLGEDLGNHIPQMVGYALEDGIPYAGLTDGNRWRLYEVFGRAPLSDKRLLDVSLADTPPHKCVLELLLLWNPNLSSGQVVGANQPLVLQEQPTTPNPTIEPLPPPKVEPTKPVQPPAGQGWIRMSDFNPPPRKRAPSAIWYADGTSEEIKWWKDIPIQTANWLHSKGLLGNDKLPVPSGGKSYIVHSSPQQADGSQMKSFETTGGGALFVNTWISAKAARENAKKCLEHCGVNPASIWLLPTEDS